MRNRILIGTLLSLAPLAASAHVTLVEPSATPGAQYVAHFRVGHGCSGSPTIALSIAIPQGVVAVQAQPAPGWTLETTSRSVTWKDGSLAAATPGEFAVAMTLPAHPGVLAFAATQSCAVGVENWSDLPVAGEKSAHPAPLLYIGVAAPKPDGMAPGMAMPDGSHM